MLGSRPERSQGTDQALAKRTSAPSRRGHILIPAIGVEAPLMPLGLAAEGTLEVPQDWGVAGWFTGGPFPGEPGPAVVAGHVDSTVGPAVFYRLPELRPGDVIVVWRNGDVRSRFRVTSLKWFPKSAFPTQSVYGSVASPALRLITCGGAFDRSTGHYVDNLVVFATPVTEPNRSSPAVRRSPGRRDVRRPR
jgi:sortase (surface protein transpeptidase)